MRTLIKAGIVLAGITASQQALTHAEHDKGRFVAPNGQDEGRCDNRFRPCQTISYAVSKANKGDIVMVAAGSYQITGEQALFNLTSQIVPVRGGYDRVNNYQIQNPNQFRTRISGVPLSYAQQLSEQGFDVIVDRKDNSQYLSIANSHTLQLMNQTQGQADCNNGSANGFMCNNVGLYSHVPLSSFSGSQGAANDIWGHVDLNDNREYAILGLQKGLAVIDVTDPANPNIVGQINGARSTWRDIKVYQYYDANLHRWQAYAYSTTEASEGLSIVDLNNLPNSISLVRRQTTDSSAHNIYISNVDYSLNTTLPDVDAAVHIVGSSNFGGAMRTYNLSDPKVLGATFSPTGSNRSDYTHDAASLIVDDSRQSACPNSNTQGCTVLLDFNENEMRLWDHTDLNSTHLLSARTYQNAAYTHSGWATEDKQYVLLHDELDEQDFGLKTTIRVFKINDLTAPTLVRVWTGPTAAIDHNGFVLGNRYYVSNYTRGLTVLDITDPANPSEVGFFDTYPASDQATFNGAWGVYPYLPSGTLLVSDINSGLYILKDQTTGNSSVNFAQSQYSADEGQSLSVVINKTGSQATSVGYQVLNGSTDNNDHNLQSGTLSWAANDTGSQSINIDLAEDNIDEATESLFIRLFNPQNGTSLSGSNPLRIDINGTLTHSGAIGFVQSNVSVRENQGSVEVEIQRSGGSLGELIVDYALISDSAQAGEDIQEISGQLSWPDGNSAAQSLTLQIIDDQATESTESLRLQLTPDQHTQTGVTQMQIEILDDESNQAPIVNTGDDQEVNPRQNVTITAAVSDDQQDPLTLKWQQMSGAVVSLNNTSEATLHFTAPESASTLQFRLRATDVFGAVTQDTVTVKVVETSTPAPAPTPAPTPQPENKSTSGGGSFGLFSTLLIGAMLVRRGEKTSKRHFISTH